ncbi:MAG: endo-1,4-beta-xylanase [Fibrobacterota bacterium]|nr:endo-1,4-beta-xylanase [Fibrobacterota bacterium]QQS03344.1 MAG: endo-1,4-beta-xylanase [Fibrobacterota bacterium]
MCPEAHALVKIWIAALLLTAGADRTHAQLAKGGTKFLGNITSRDDSYLDAVKPDFLQYWNQITAENVCKWGSVEGTQGQKNWARCDSVYRYAKKHQIPFKYHTLVWGSQYPYWMDNLAKDKQLAAVVDFMDSAAARYPEAELIDVVNEPYHAFPKSWALCLGDTSITNPVWIVKSFQMARKRWPKAKLVLNDYNNFRWDVDKFIQIVQAVQKIDPALIDAIGCQAHDLGATTGQYVNPEMTASDLAAVLKKLHDGTGLPIYVSELDLSYEDDQTQLAAYKSLFPVIWESPYVAGVTIWGYIYGKTWEQAKFSGLIKNEVDRPAFTWLKQYVKDNPNPPSPTSDVKKRLGVGASTGPKGLTVRSIEGRLEMGVVREGRFQRIGVNGRD